MHKLAVHGLVPKMISKYGSKSTRIFAALLLASSRAVHYLSGSSHLRLMRSLLEKFALKVNWVRISSPLAPLLSVSLP